MALGRDIKKCVEFKVRGLYRIYPIHPTDRKVETQKNVNNILNSSGNASPALVFERL